MNWPDSELLFRFWGLVCTGLVLSAAAPLGRLLVLRTSNTPDQATEKLPADRLAYHLLALCIGFNLLSWLAVIWDAVGISDPRSHTATLIALASVGWFSWSRSLIGWVRKRGAGQRGRWLRGQRLLRHSLLSVLGVLAVAPAVGLPDTWDELVYHAELPNRWLASQTLAVYWDLPYSAFPSLVEINSWLVASLDPYIAPRLIPSFFWLTALGLVYVNIRLYLHHGLAVCMTCAWGLSETVLLVGGGGYVEPVLMTNTLLILYCIQRPELLRGQGTWRSATQLGILAGGCAAIKVTGVSMLLPAMLVWVGLKKISVCQRSASAQTAIQLRGVMLTCGGFLLFLMPFFLRSWLATGNPIFPYFDSWFTAELARIESSQFHHAIGGEQFGLHGFATLLFSPFLLSFDQSLYDGTFGWQSALWWTFCALQLMILARGRRWDSTLILLIASSGWLFLFWFLTTQQARFAIVAQLAVLMLAARLLKDVSSTLRTWLVGTAVVAALLSAPWPAANFYVSGWLSGLGLIASQELLPQATGTDYVLLVEAINELTPADSRLLLVLEQRGFYIPRPVAIATPFFQSQTFTPPEEFTTAASVYAALRAQDATHLVLATRPLGPDIPERWAERFPFLQQGINQAAHSGALRLVWECETYQLLEVRQSP